ncbi:MAG: hypothetical protein RLZ04_1069 [Actinomycetota bacterium]|jgi:hypothetical protein
MQRWMPSVLALVVLGGVVFAGVKGNEAETAAPNTVPVTAPPTSFETTTTIVKTELTETIRRGSMGDDVAKMQQRLKDMGFDPGPIDGQFGTGTEQAVWAFQGLVYNTRYDQQDGVVTPEVWSRMQDPLPFTPRRPQGVGTRHMEIYLDLQAAIVYADDKPVLLTHISSGSNEEWCEVTTRDTDRDGMPLAEPVVEDVCGLSRTPGGVFKFTRRYAGNRQGPLGGMYNPVYFNYGIAVHGAVNVPNEPASHGCIRIPMFISEYFPSLVEKGDYVYVWDGIKEPEEQSEQEMIPPFNWLNPNSTLTTSTSSTLPLVVPPGQTTTTVAAPTTTVAATTTSAATTTTAKPTTTSGG